MSKNGGVSLIDAGDQLRCARLKRGWTQAQLGGQVAAGTATISQLERGRSSRPRPDLERRLVAALGLEESPWPPRPDVPRGGCGVPGCADPDCEVPFGLCHCGCGQPTRLVAETSLPRNQVAGAPRLYVRGHQTRRACGHFACPAEGCRWTTGFVGARDNGDRLRELRLTRGMTQPELARVADVGPKTICDLEGIVGVRTAVDKAERIAAALAVALDVVFTSDVSEARPTERVQTRRRMKPGDAARAAAAELERYCEEQGLWTGLKAAGFLGLDPKMVSYLVAREHLKVAERRTMAPFSATLFLPADVKRFARERWQGGREAREHRIHYNPDRVFRWAMRRWKNLDRAERLKDQVADRNRRHAAIRIDFKLYRRWSELWSKLQEDCPEEKPNLLLGQVALLDWQQHPEDWPRSSYPARRTDPLDFADARIREAARDRVQQALLQKSLQTTQKPRSSAPF
jgi:transcriptional regulator with XRE-family HTH domain